MIASEKRMCAATTVADFWKALCLVVVSAEYRDHGFVLTEQYMTQHANPAVAAAVLELLKNYPVQGVLVVTVRLPDTKLVIDRTKLPSSLTTPAEWRVQFVNRTITIH